MAHHFLSRRSVTLLGALMLTVPPTLRSSAVSARCNNQSRQTGLSAGKLIIHNQTLLRNPVLESVGTTQDSPPSSTPPIIRATSGRHGPLVQRLTRDSLVISDVSRAP